MTKLDLHPFGFPCDVEVHGVVEDAWSGRGRLAFVIGENHKDREMKRLNLLDACALCDLGIVGCVGVEETLKDLGYLGAEMIAQVARAVPANIQDDEA